MKKTFITVNAFIKGLVLVLHPHLYLGWLKHPFMTISNILKMTSWIARQDKTDIYNDFYSPRRDYDKRYGLYRYVVNKFELDKENIDYLEFGVSGGNSFRWWVENCPKKDNSFFGFDTFEGLPEKWGTFSKGAMAAQMPVYDDNRVQFIKGLFQDTMQDFIKNNNLNNGKRKIIHLDADLFSATLFVLTSLAPYLKKGDILFFDEFNVPNHEFFAFKLFADSFYVKTKLLGAVNNYFQIALIIE